jgi:hypothetical protein
MYTIDEARSSDLPLLPTIELAAATALAGHAPASVLAETTDQAELEDAQQRGHLWVARAAEVPVGFAHVKVSSLASHTWRKSMFILNTAVAESGGGSSSPSAGGQRRTGIHASP